ncbi:MAG: hypothetical protein ACRECU_04825, partial [Methylocella sp.]
RSPRVGRGREAAAARSAASAFAADDQQVQAVAPQGDEVEASPARAEAGAREPPQSTPSDVAPGRDEIPSRLEESAPMDTLDPARPKRSGWWQRARASRRG